MYIMIHRLAELLKERGAKIRLAEAIGKPASVISDICSGKDRLNDTLIEAIANALRIPPWHLFVDPATIYPAETKAIVDAYNGLAADDRKIVDKFLFPNGHTSGLKKTAT